MSTQAEQASTQDVEGKTASNVTEKINKLVDVMVKDDKGSWSLPEGTEADEVTAFAAMAERRRRDTQSEYTKTAQKVKTLEAEKATLLSKALNDTNLTLTPEQQTELDDLKFSDPDEWRKKVNSLEREHKAKQVAAIDEELKQVSSSTLVSTELEQREAILTEFNASHEDFPITQTVIDNDIPPRIVKKLETGKITFAEFLEEVYSYAKTGKVVHDASTPEMPNLGKVPGSSKPDSKAVDKDISVSYLNTTF